MLLVEKVKRQNVAHVSVVDGNQHTDMRKIKSQLTWRGDSEDVYRSPQCQSACATAASDSPVKLWS
jgi:hypothetical protein